MTLIDAPTMHPDTTSDPSTAPSASLDGVALARDVGTQLRAGVSERDRSGEISPAVFDQLRATGLTAALVPTEHGGGGVGHAGMGAILRELGRHDAPTAVTLAMHSHLLAAQVWRHRRGMDASALFRKVVDDRAILATSGANDWVGSSGTVRRVDGGYRVSGRKGPVSGCEVANIVITSFRWADGPDGAQVVHCSVPRSAEGVSIDHTWDTLGMRATGSHTVVFDDVFVPDAAVPLVRPADVWHPVWNTVIGCAMPLIMAAYLGIADAAVEIATAAAAGRTDGPTTQLMGELCNAHLTAGDVVDAMFRDTDDLTFANVDTLTARVLSRKTVATDAIIETVRIAAEIAGGQGFLREAAMAQLQRDVLGTRFHPLPTAKQLHFCGRVALGLTPVG